MQTITPKYENVPEHVAIIMDGNGRWAQERGMARPEGHVAGVKTVRRITEHASRLGIKYLTLYTFSTENWNRPATEVELLMTLIVNVIAQETPDLIKNNVRLQVIGDLSRMPAQAREALNQSIADTAHCTGLNLVLAISYSARWEIVEAARKLAERVAEGIANAAEITDQDFANALTTKGMPDPDLLVRTGGDMRISNFLLWQLAYSELYFTQKYWPDFNESDLDEAISTFNSRQRRFGLTGEQVETKEGLKLKT